MPWKPVVTILASQVDQPRLQIEAKSVRGMALGRFGAPCRESEGPSRSLGLDGLGFGMLWTPFGLPRAPPGTPEYPHFLILCLD